MSDKKHKDGAAAQPLLLQKRLPERGRVGFVLYHYGLLLICCAVLTVCTLMLAYSSFTGDIFKGYFERPLIVLVNFAVAFSVCLLLFGIIGKAWIAFLLTSFLCLGVAIGNYYLIIIRNDPLQFEDLTCIREALAITEKEGYELELNSRILISVAACLGLTGALALLSRWRMRLRWTRLIPVLVGAAAVWGAVAAVGSSKVWELTKHYKYINTWSVTEIYTSRGVLYPFLRSGLSSANRPAGYSAGEVRTDLARYTEADIPNDRKVDVFVVMRESYSDLSELSCDRDAIDFSGYDLYHELVSESVMVGNLVTNGFGGNTKNAERCFLTGNYTLQEWRKPTNSYVWYLREQGFRAEGAHPFNGWFYNRRNVNRYIGFEDYMFREDGFEAFEQDDKVVDDDVLYDMIWRQYQDYLKTEDGPYFNFSVTYEGHGPYAYSFNKYSGRYVKRDENTADGFAMNNYLGCCARRDGELEVLIDRFRASERPIVLLTYGDHKATLGKDINNYTTSAYERFGMDVDLSTEQGFFNYYSTDYVIWMNDAARQKLGITGGVQTGPTISPCYLMNVLFDTLGWGDGPAYLQAMAEEMESIPVYSTKGRISVDGSLSTTVPASYQELYNRMQKLAYYWQTEYLYEHMSK